MKSKRWWLLLLVPWLALLLPPLYNRTSPTLLGFPFFYWYQFALVPLTALITAVVHRKTR